MGLYTKHELKWKNCTDCRLSECRKRIVLGKGKVPADVLFCGEAPGISEDALGEPFVGPAGKELDKQIKQAELESGKTPRKFWTNIVACIPKIPTTNRKAEEPLPEEIAACRDRLEEVIKIAKPKLIVAVGKLAAKEAKDHNWARYGKIIEVDHPAFIMRITNPSQKKHHFDLVITRLSNAFSQWL